MSDLPAPPVPPECSMGTNDWFPLHFDRLRKSKWWRRASDLARARNVMLWGEAYKAVPAGSLEDDDDDLAEAAGFGMDVDAFLAVKDELMAPWTLCSDGRWYHPTLCEVVLDTWSKVGDRRRKDAERKAGQRRKTRGQAAAGEGVPPENGGFPQDKADVPRDTGQCPAGHSTQEKTGQESPQPPDGGTADLFGFDEGWSHYPIAGRANHGEDLAAAEWPAAVRAAGGADRLIDAIRAHAAQVAASRARVKAFHRWLRDKGFSAYLRRPEAAAAQPADPWHGPADVADVLARGMGDGKAASSYLARCAWQDMPVRAVVAPDEFTRGKLLEAGLGRAGYEVIVRGRAA